MTPRDLLIVGAVLGVVAWRLRRAAQDSAQGVADAMRETWGQVAGIPGRVVDAVAGAAETATQDFVKVPTSPARVVDYRGVRDTASLDRYFATWGNTEATRASARRQGWSDDEIGLSVLTMAGRNGSIDGWQID